MRLLAAASLLCALDAFAQARRVAPVSFSAAAAGELDAARVGLALDAALQGDARFEWVSAATQARDDGPSREVKALDAQRLTGEAREQLDNLAFAKALASLDKAVKFHEESDLSLGANGLVDALALRALTAFAKGDKGGFGNDAQRVLAMRPAYAWDESRLTPAAAAALAPLKKKAEKAAPATLAVDSTPKGARVFVDGAFKGVTPVTVSDLAAGSHMVTLVSVGHELAQERVFAGPGATSAHTLKPSPRGKDVLAAIGELKAAALSGGDPASKATALCRLLTADELLVASLASGDAGAVKISVWRLANDGTEVAAADATVPASEAPAKAQALARELLAKAAPDVKRLEPAGQEKVIVVGEEDHSGRRPIGWICAAGALGALGAGIALGLAAKGRAAEANQLPQVDVSGYQRLAGQARTQAAVADALFGVAVVAAGVSLFLLITGYTGGESSGDEETALLWPGSSVARAAW